MTFTVLHIPARGLNGANITFISKKAATGEPCPFGNKAVEEYSTEVFWSLQLATQWQAVGSFICS